MISIQRFLYFLLIIFLVILTACNITRKTKDITKDTAITPHVIDNKLLKNSNTSKGIIITGAKIKIQSNGQTNRLRANLKVKPDSAILLSLSNPLGIEIVRALITPDSIRFIDRINRNYLQGPYDVIASMYHIPTDFNLLQDALTDVYSMYFQSFHYPQQKYKSYQGIYSFKKENDKMTFFYQIDNSQFFIQQVAMDFHNFTTKISVAYSNYTKFDDVYVHLDIKATIYETIDESIKVDIHYTNLRFEPVDINLHVPSTYQKIYP